MMLLVGSSIDLNSDGDVLAFGSVQCSFKFLNFWFLSFIISYFQLFMPWVCLVSSLVVPLWRRLIWWRYRGRCAFTKDAQKCNAWFIFISKCRQCRESIWISVTHLRRWWYAQHSSPLEAINTCYPLSNFPKARRIFFLSISVLMLETVTLAMLGLF